MKPVITSLLTALMAALICCQSPDSGKSPVTAYPDVCLTKDPVSERKGGATRAWADNSRKWGPNQTVANDRRDHLVLTVEPHGYISRHTWDRIQLYFNGFRVPNGLSFNFISKKKGAGVIASPSKSDIRAEVVTNGGSWSYVGNDCRLISQNKPTMRLGMDPGGNDLMRLAHHECGHALGLLHEHQHPDGDIQWNRAQVYADMELRGWSHAESERNIIAKPNVTNFTSSGYNPKSVMHYSFPETWTTNGFSAPWNIYIDQSDYDLISAWYP